MNNETLTKEIDLDGLMDQARVFISPTEVDSEIEERLTKILNSDCVCLVFHPDGAAPGGHRPAPAVLGMDDTLKKEVRTFLAHEMVENTHQQYLNSMLHLELRCRREEASRRVNKLIAEAFHLEKRRAA